MSYSVELVDVYRCPECGHEADVGSVVFEMEPTFNYRPLFVQYLNPDSLWYLHDMRAKDTISMLDDAVRQLGIVRDDDSWAATPGNAGYVLHRMAQAARQWPDAVWNISG